MLFRLWINAWKWSLILTISLPSYLRQHVHKCNLLHNCTSQFYIYLNGLRQSSEKIVLYHICFRIWSSKLFTQSQSDSNSFLNIHLAVYLLWMIEKVNFTTYLNIHWSLRKVVYNTVWYPIVTAIWSVAVAFL